MTTQSVLMSSNETVLLFDDRALLQAALGGKVLPFAAINANCDCVSHAPTEDDEDLNPDQVPSIARQAA